jgi:PAS domain S-box-containing protein
MSDLPSVRDHPLEILIAEDSPTQAQQLRYILDQEGYSVTLARNGREALEAARARKPAIIISDVVMPEMDGYQFCRQVKADPTLNEIPVILVTTMSEPQDVIKGLECGADNFILKPYDRDYLLNRLNFILLHRRMRQSDRTGMGVQIVFNGEEHFITADRLQILNLLLSTYEGAVQRNKALVRAEDRIREMNKKLEQLVARRTEQLRESEQRFRLMIESVKEYSIIMLDPEGRVVNWNSGATRLKGYRAEQIIGRHFSVFYPPERNAEKFPENALGIAAEHGSFRNIGWRVRQDGSRFWANVTINALRDEAGQLRGFVKVTRDLTEERRVEEEIRALNASLERRVEERTAELVRSNATLADFKAALDEHALVAITDARGRITYVNDKFCAISRYTREELLGQDHRIINSGLHTKGFFRELWETITAGKVWQGEIRNRAKDGTQYWVDTTIVPFLGEEGKPVQFIAIRADITARKRAEESLQRANEEIARASRHKDEFLANMSHELRTPLNAILGLSESLLEQIGGPLTPRQVKSVTTISSSGQHLLSLINDILDLSKIEAGKVELHPENLDIRDFCESCLVFVRTQAMHKHIEVAFETDGPAQSFPADAKRFKQVLVNLLTNAVKFTPEGGRIGLTVSAAESGEEITFTVWDTGIGIASTDASKLFQAFTQIDSGLNRSQEGTGLGLALVARLVELHGGSVSLESEPGKGSRFIVRLPLKSCPVPVPSVAHTQQQKTLAKVRHVLVIEDNPTAGEQLVRYLGDLNLTSALHHNGEGVVEVVLREKPDVVILDILLPNQSGWVVLAKLKEHPGTRHIPVIVVSVVDEPAKSRALGAVAHVVKPVSREQLAELFAQTIEKKTASASPFTLKTGAPPKGGARILLAEDNDANLTTIGGYLEDLGYEMHYAGNGQVAVEMARSVRPALILMDVQMPVMDGLTAMRELKADRDLQGIPVIALTALAMTGDREQCLAAGAVDYMSKPVKLKALAALVTRLLSSSQAPKP